MTYRRFRFKVHGINGIVLLRFPDSPSHCRDLARDLATNIQNGATIGLPNSRDEYGEYLWDLKVVGGDQSQVECVEEMEEIG